MSKPVGPCIGRAKHAIFYARAKLTLKGRAGRNTMHRIQPRCAGRAKAGWSIRACNTNLVNPIMGNSAVGSVPSLDGDGKYATLLFPNHVNALLFFATEILSKVSLADKTFEETRQQTAASLAVSMLLCEKATRALRRLRP